VPPAKEFYSAAVGLLVYWDDADSAVFKFGDTLVNLLNASEALELIEPQLVGPANGGSRFQLTVTVDDVDGTCTEQRRRGVELLNGPVDRPWGVRTAAFRDPAGHVWEISSFRR
jgi:catechol 2,3-dioxygenase-like lactoylglutathione lyase family enzyme